MVPCQDKLTNVTLLLAHTVSLCHTLGYRSFERLAVVASKLLAGVLPSSAQGLALADVLCSQLSEACHCHDLWLEPHALRTTWLERVVCPYMFYLHSCHSQSLHEEALPRLLHTVATVARSAGSHFLAVCPFEFVIPSSSPGRGQVHQSRLDLPLSGSDPDIVTREFPTMRDL